MPGILIKNTDSDILDQFNKAMIRKFNTNSARIMKQIEDDLKSLMSASIENSDVWQSLKVGGELSAELGLPRNEVEGRLDRIKNTWINSIRVMPPKSRYFGRVFAISIIFNGVKSDYSDVLALTEASIDAEPSKFGISKQKGQHTQLKWLDYLLNFGDRAIIPDYKVQFKNLPATRSGKAQMIISPGNSWKIPSQYAGTSDNNFLTRIIREVLDGGLLDFLLFQTLKTAFKD